MFDRVPEQADGQSQVDAAAAMGSRCVVTLKAGVASSPRHPAMFTVSAAADGCKASG